MLACLLCLLSLTKKESKSHHGLSGLPFIHTVYLSQPFVRLITGSTDLFFTHPLSPLLLKMKGKQIAEWPSAIVETIPLLGGVRGGF
jgi:hypothetical protein